jgi:hypothetical protein
MYGEYTNYSPIGICEKVDAVAQYIALGSVPKFRWE